MVVADRADRLLAVLVIPLVETASDAIAVETVADPRLVMLPLVEMVAVANSPYYGLHNQFVR